VPVRLVAAAVTDIGPQRSVNQDAAFTAPWGAAVADGVGGGPAGDLASATFIHRLAAGSVGSHDIEQLEVNVRLANWDLRAHIERDPSLYGMATTFTGLLASRRSTLLLAHTGDSRAYRLRAGVLRQETHDDSYVQVLVDHGLMTAEEAASHPQRNLITSSLSGGETDGAVVVEYDVQQGDRWLLCSDGLTDYVPDADLAALLMMYEDPRTAALACVSRALRAGTHDNVTAVVCDVAHVDTRAGVRSLETARDPVFYGSAAERFREGLESA
jgi:protein phosphatase